MIKRRCSHDHEDMMIRVGTQILKMRTWKILSMLSSITLWLDIRSYCTQLRFRLIKLTTATNILKAVYLVETFVGWKYFHDYVLDQFSHYVDTFRWTAAWYAVPCSKIVWFSSVPHVPAMISQGRIGGLPPPLTHWGRVTHICVSKLTPIGSYNGLSPGRRQAIIWTNDEILIIRTLGTNFNEILSEIHSFSFKKMHLKMASAIWRLFRLGLYELKVSIIGWRSRIVSSLGLGGRPGPRLNIKTVLSTYGDFHVKDKTAVRTSYL